MRHILAEINTNCDHLTQGWPEKIEYTVRVHRSGCFRPARGCSCPVVEEKRARTVKRPGLLKQLEEFHQHKDTDREPKAERGAPRVKVPGRPPGDLAGFLCLDEITCDAYSSLDRIFEAAGRDRTWLAQPLTQLLGGLGYQVSQFDDDNLAHEVARLTSKWVANAKRTLRLTVSDAMFNDSVCPCGGALTIAWDDTGTIRCIGTPAAPPCGTAYGPSDWIALYDQQSRSR